LIAVSEVGKKNQKLQEFFGERERELQNPAHGSIDLGSHNPEMAKARTMNL